jgi:hypothetical protein
MNRRIVLLNLALIALAGVLAWQLRIRWRDAQAHAHDVLSQSPRAKQILAPPPPPALKTTSPADYVDVAQRTLFSRDRNPNVIVDAPPPPPPPPPMPALPRYHGQMSLGEPVVILSLGSADQKSYRAGAEVGPFTLLKFDRENITFEWRGEPVERTLAELKPKEAVVAANAPAPAAAPAQAVQPLSSLTPLAAPSNTPNTPVLGVDMGGGSRGCAPGDNSPAGTILSGYRKVVVRTVMGNSCHWEQVSK